MVLQKSEFIYLIIVASMVIFILLLFFITVIVINVKIRKQKEIEKLNAMIEMQEQERSRIAEDMHDELGPMLSAIKLKLNSVKLLKSVPDVTVSLTETSADLDRVIQDVRNIVRNISPTNMSKYGLIQSIVDYKNTIERDDRISVEFLHEGMEGRLNENAEINIYRIISEMINNSLKHSNGSRIKIIMKMFRKKTSIVYVDDGSSEENRFDFSGMGLKSIRARVNLLHGQLETAQDFSNGAFYQIVFDNKNIS